MRSWHVFNHHPTPPQSPLARRRRCKPRRDAGSPMGRARALLARPAGRDRRPRPSRRRKLVRAERPRRLCRNPQSRGLARPKRRQTQPWRARPRSLGSADAAAAAEALGAIDPEAYRSFNLVVGDNTNVFHVANRARADRIAVEPFPDGLSMLTSQEINDRRNARIDGFLSEFETATPPDPDTGTGRLGARFWPMDGRTRR